MLAIVSYEVGPLLLGAKLSEEYRIEKASSLGRSKAKR